jgi:hypothetical protein
MRPVVGTVRNQLLVSTGEGTSNIMDIFVDDDGSLVAMGRDDPRHPLHVAEEDGDTAEVPA